MRNFVTKKMIPLGGILGVGRSDWEFIRNLAEKREVG